MSLNPNSFADSAGRQLRDADSRLATLGAPEKMSDSNTSSPAPIPWVTEERIAKKIKYVEYSGQGTLTICIIEMHTGFKFLGKSSCVDERLYDRDKGRELAYKDAFNQIWSHEGYLLAERLYMNKSCVTQSSNF